MEKILYTVDELTGIIWAASLMRPSKSVQDMNLKSVKKKFKDKKFAAGCNRDIIKEGANILGWDMDKLFTDTLDAMKETEENFSQE
jgi:predicted hydrolase (HD superfamily)